MRAIARENRETQVVPLSSALDRVEGGAEVSGRRSGMRGKRSAAADAKAARRSKSSSGNFRSIPLLPSCRLLFTLWRNGKRRRSTGQPNCEELVDYLEYFREAGGVIPLQANETENAVRLMTVHGAKGLEFPHVFILRANLASFPCSYKETLVAFPRELARRGFIDRSR